MTNHTDEKFSVFFDGELSGIEHKDLLDKVCRDKATKDRWSRYHLIRDSLRSNLPQAVDPQFSQNIMNAIESEPAIIALPRKYSIKDTVAVLQSKPFMKRAAGFAIAASVAAIAVTSFQFNIQPQSTPELTAATDSKIKNVSNTPALPPKFAQISNPNLANTNSGTLVQSQSAVPMTASSKVVTSRKLVTKKPPFNAQLHKYLINHHQHVSGAQLQGVMPYARIVVGTSAPIGQAQK